LNYLITVTGIWYTGLWSFENILTRLWCILFSFSLPLSFCLSFFWLYLKGQPAIRNRCCVPLLQEVNPINLRHRCEISVRRNGRDENETFLIEASRFHDGSCNFLDLPYRKIYLLGMITSNRTLEPKSHLYSTKQNTDAVMHATKCFFIWKNNILYSFFDISYSSQDNRDQLIYQKLIEIKIKWRSGAWYLKMYFIIDIDMINGNWFDMNHATRVAYSNNFLNKTTKSIRVTVIKSHIFIIYRFW